MQEILPFSPATFTRICIYLRGKNKTLDRAFTILELAIVLVVVGIGIGGIFVGRDLIKAAEIRAQISQFQEYDAAFNTFKLKMNCSPGDCPSATELGLGTNGNGNGLLQSSTPSSYGASYNTPDGYYDGELPQFFVHLKASGLIKYTRAGTFSVGGGEFPLLAIGGKSGLIAAGQWQGGITGTIPEQLTTTYKFPAGWWLHANMCDLRGAYPQDTNEGCGVMSPAQAHAIDTKIDDGVPLTGKIWSYTAGYPSGSPTISYPCLNGTYTAYNLTNSNPYCQMSFKIQ